MNLYKLNTPFLNYTIIDNNFIDTFFPKTRGEYIKIYILILKYASCGEIGFDSSFLAKTLNMLESDVKNALEYWSEVGVIKLTNLDNKISNIEFLHITETTGTSSLNLINEINDNNLIDFFKEIEIIIGRPLSQKEMESYINWTKLFNFSYELILYLISYCVNKNKKDFRYIEKVATNWADKNIRTLEEAIIHTEKSENLFINYKKIMDYLGIRDNDIGKPQEDLFNKWLLEYNMPLELIYKACDICFSRLSKMDLNYIDGILNNFKNSNILSIQDFEKYNNSKITITRKFSKTSNKNSFSNFPQRVYNYNELEKILIKNNKIQDNTKEDENHD